jgi:nicotinate dehydrogenase subunit B
MSAGAPSRRQMLSAGGALVVSFALSSSTSRSAGSSEPAEPFLVIKAPPVPAPNLPGSLKNTPFLDSWLRVEGDGRVTVFTGKVELGQGIKTPLIQLAAEELDVAPARITLITADTARTPNEMFTAGSHSMQDSGTAIMNAAAQARQLLVAAAARRLNADANHLVVRDGVVFAPDGRNLGYGPLAAGLSLHVQAQPPNGLKDPARFSVVGRSMPRVDIPGKLTGAPAYVQDMRPPGLLHARVVRQPSYGARLRSVDTAPIERMPGVVKVVRLGSFLAVVADREWQAIKALRALSQAARWDETAVLPDPANLHAALQAMPHKDIAVLDVTGPGAPPARTLSARYTRPYLSHGSIGPSCAVGLDDGAVLTVWTHSQGVYPLRDAIAALLRLPPERVRCIHAEGAGCYGHNGADDAGADAAIIAHAVPGRPVRVQWMREQEHLSEPFGPAMIGQVEASIDTAGRIVDWRYEVWSNTHTTRPIAGGLLLQNQALPDPLPVPPPQPIPMPEGDGDRNSIPLYAIPNAKVVYHFLPQMPVRVSALRTLGAQLNVFSIESFIDELALAAKRDPIRMRLDHLQDDRARATITAAADRFGWGRWTRRDDLMHGRGFAFARYKNLAAYCAVAMDLTVEPETGQVQIGKVVAAVDAGQAVNPDGIRNQIEGSIVQATSWTLYEEVAFNRQRITSHDWASYPILRFPTAPEAVEVIVIDRPGQPFLGVGECGQGPASAAIANALTDAIGVRLRDLPLNAAKVRAAIGV